MTCSPPFTSAFRLLQVLPGVCLWMFLTAPRHLLQRTAGLRGQGRISPVPRRCLQPSIARPMPLGTAIERPVRTGDWIVVGNTEGHVRRISIRPTQIETYDRADVSVPNSELISSQVTNWMFNDPWCRVTVAIGVAPGTDVEQLRELLLQAAMNHTLVIKDGAKVNPLRCCAVVLVTARQTLTLQENSWAGRFLTPSPSGRGLG